MDWILQRLPSGRVIIDSVLAPGASVVECIPTNSWFEASDQVPVERFTYRPGYGYFMDQ